MQKQKLREVILKSIIKEAVKSSIPEGWMPEPEIPDFPEVPAPQIHFIETKPFIQGMNRQQQFPEPWRQRQTSPQQPQNSLEKIYSLLRDPNIFSIECPGPRKNLLVNRAGAVQTTSTILLKEEIDNIIKQISEQTRIPAVSGLFKAMFGNFLITAVISEFVGTRFIIQKRTPFRRY